MFSENCQAVWEIAGTLRSVRNDRIKGYFIGFPFVVSALIKKPKPLEISWFQKKIL